MSRSESIADWSPPAAGFIASFLGGDQSACSPRECLNQFTRSTCPTNGDHLTTLEARYGLTPDAARLLEWIESRDRKEMLGNWTPVVEPAIKPEIGIAADWPEENLPALLQMLSDEIREKTDYDLSLQPWRENGKLLTRIKVSRRNARANAMKVKLDRAAREAGLEFSESQLANIASALLSSGTSV